MIKTTKVFLKYSIVLTSESAFITFIYNQFSNTNKGTVLLKVFGKNAVTMADREYPLTIDQLICFTKEFPSDYG